MSDIINDFFHRFYPPDASTNWRATRGPNGTIMREYCGDRAKWNKIFPEIVCADGFKLSVQGHNGGYSYPRDDFADRYEQVEIMAPTGIPEFGNGHEYGDGLSIYGYVPIASVEAVIMMHGGLKT